MKVPPISGNASEDVKSDFWFSEQFVKEQLRLACVSLVRTATEKEDWNDGTDTVLSGVKIAHRIRRVSNCGSRRDITIRSHRSSGSMTELQKMNRGKFKSNVYLFGWVDDALKNEIIEWVSIDVAIFIERFLPLCVPKKNRDGKTEFVYLPIKEAGESIIEHYIKPFELPARPYCPHPVSKWVDSPAKRGAGWIATTCTQCGRWIGNRPQR